MGQMKEEIKGAANQAAGKTRQVVGEALGDEQMRQNGEAQERRGEVQDVKGDVEGELGNDV